MNNTPDYENNLAFEPEMTWEDLVKWAEEFCKLNQLFFDLNYGFSYLTVGELNCRNDGLVDCGCCSNTLAQNRTPRQMQTIIKALYE